MKKKKKDSSINSGTTTSLEKFSEKNENPQQDEPPNQQPQESKEPQLLEQAPTQPLEPEAINPAYKPETEPEQEAPKRRGRPKGSKNNTNTTPKADDVVNVTLSRETFETLAIVYGTVLQASGLEPELTTQEREAIAVSSQACAARYLKDFQHFELVALALALSTPVVGRVLMKKQNEGKKNEPGTTIAT